MKVAVVKLLWRSALAVFAVLALAYAFYSYENGTDNVEPPLLSLGDGMIEVLSANYGRNCVSEDLAWYANKAYHVAYECNGKTECPFLISPGRIGDVAPGCQKEFDVSWRCARDEAPRRLAVPAGADGKSVILGCGETDGR